MDTPLVSSHLIVGTAACTARVAAGTLRGQTDSIAVHRSRNLPSRDISVGSAMLTTPLWLSACVVADACLCLARCAAHRVGYSLACKPDVRIAIDSDR